MAEKPAKVLGMRREPQQARSKRRVNQILDTAEQMFIEDGYEAATTNAISVRAGVPIGSLYQFFPDKSAILQALAVRYGELLRRRIATLNTDEALTLPLSDYAKQLVDVTERFFSEHPGYHAIFIAVQGTMPEIAAIEETTDALLIDDLAAFLAKYRQGLLSDSYGAIAFVLVKAIGTLIWLSLDQEPQFQQRLVAETERLVLHYLKSYFND